MKNTVAPNYGRLIREVSLQKQGISIFFIIFPCFFIEKQIVTQIPFYKGYIYCLNLKNRINATKNL
jgi:hypothetical protein